MRLLGVALLSVSVLNALFAFLQEMRAEAPLYANGQVLQEKGKNFIRAAYIPAVALVLSLLIVMLTLARGISAGLDNLKPASVIYQNLVSALAQYRAIQTNGGWIAVDEGPTLRKGESGLRVAQLRLRLLGEGDLAAAPAIAADTTP